jgi:rare lipoprotein A
MEVGFASWYGGKFQGRQTASGERFDTNKLTAAHKTLPFGTIVRVTNLENNLSVEVRINDRGPFIKGRIIDLSRAAADAIGMAGKGIALVKVEQIGSEQNGKKVPENYIIQIGAYRIRDNALRTQERIEKLGLDVDLEQAASKVIRVMVVNISAESLEEVKKQLRQAGFIHVLVKKGISD